VDVVVFLTPGLGNASYLIGSEREAVLVDPQRDVERFLTAADDRDWRISAVIDTHVHNDYLSGALEVRARTGAELVLPARGGYAFPHRRADEGDTVEFGDLRAVARSTPGHTPEHLSWEVHEGDAGPPAAILTGGSLLAGSVGRTDLLGPDRTPELTADQYRTIRRIARLPDATRVLPTHGSGSFCAAGPIVSDRVTTLGAQRRRNPLLALAEEPAFAATLLAGLGEYPAYYRSMAPINRAGPPVLGGVPVPATIAPDDVERRVGAGAWIVDARARTTFAAAHIPGSLNIELGDTFAAYVGWLAPFDAPLVLVVPEPTGEATIEAATQLHRIGFDHVRGVLRGGIDAWAATGRPLAAYPTVTAGEVVDAEGRGESVELLDVRQPIEWRDEGAVPGARRIFVGDLPGRLDELPRDRPITVLCRSGQRAAIAASILDRAGIEVRLVAEGGAPAWQRATSSSTSATAGASSG
jgi:glyoxylase-like metal-dependent hydrolase (beta-lactamase superfamily II)/rhodanese-related sulfurtransferase